MKKILIVFGVLTVLAIIALAVFIVTFDANRFKPFLLQKLGDSLGQSVEIGDVSLAFRGGIALCAKNIAVLERAGGEGRTVIGMEEASVVIRLLPLLHHAFEAGAVKIVKPRFELVREADGSVNVAGFGGKPRASKETPSASPAVSIPFLIDTISVEDGEIRFTDKMQKPVFQSVLRVLDIELKHVSLVRPVTFGIRAAVFSDRQNFELKGRFHLQGTERPPVIDEGEVMIDLGATDTQEVLRAIPAAKNAGLRENLQGNLSVQVNDFEPSPEALGKLKARIRFENGRIALTDIQGPIEKIRLDAIVENNTLNVREFSADFADGKLKAAATVNTLSTQPAAAFKAELRGLNLGKVLPPPEAGEPRLAGILSSSFQGNARGRTMPELEQSLSGSGRLNIANGVLLNLNLLKEILQQLSVIPGLTETLMGRLPESYRAKLQEKNTVFQPVDIPFAVQNGAISSDRLLVATDSLELSGAGEIRLNGALAVQSMVRIDSELSQAFIRSVKELQYLTFEDGRLGFPLKVHGTAEKPVILPDLQYIATKLAVNKTQEMLGNLLERALDKKGSQSAGTGSSTSASQTQGGTQGTAPQGNDSSLEDLLGALLGAAGQKK